MATLAEKKAFLASRGITAATMVVAVNSDTRSMTDSEFDDYVDRFVSDPEEIIARESVDPMVVNAWKNGRITEYPKTDPQLDAIFHGFKTLRSEGINIGPEASAWVDYVQSIKDKYPKP